MIMNASLHQRFGKQLEKTITGVLTPLGFDRQRRRWHRIKGSFIELVDLQSSRWGPQFYLNAGISIRGISPLNKPRLDDCHIYARLGEEPLGRALDGEDTTLNDVMREAIIEEALKGEFLRWFEDMEDLQLVIRLFDSRKLWPPSTLINEEAQAYMRTLL